MNAVKSLANGSAAVPGMATETAFKEFLRVFGLMERIMHAHFARFGISGSQWGVLRVLDRARKEGQRGLRITDLSDRLLIRPPSVTGAIDRLEGDTRPACADITHLRNDITTPTLDKRGVARRINIYRHFLHVDWK